MRTIFGNAIVTLSFFDSLFLRKRFLHPRDAKICSWYLQACRQPHMHNKKKSWDIRKKSPLMSRGWTFQEELLSPRMLYLHNQGPYWSCGKAMDRKFQLNRVNPVNRRLREHPQSFCFRRYPTVSSFILSGARW